MSDFITAIAGIGLVLIFPILIIAFYRWQARDRERLLTWHEEDQESVRRWADEQRDNIERRARKEM